MKPAPILPAVPTTQRELLIAGLRHADSQGDLLNAIASELNRQLDKPVTRRRWTRMQSLLIRRHCENSGVFLFIAAGNLRIRLPTDLRSEPREDDGE